MSKQITVSQLARLCRIEVNKGNGDKKIVISDDNEGNGYHGLFFGFAPTKGTFEGEYAPYLYDVQGDNYDEFVILG